MKQKVDLCFLQETYSTKEVQNIWKKQWKVEMFFSLGLEHSRGVLILIKNSLEFELISVQFDKEGHFIFLEAFVQDQKFLFVNIYAPNKLSEQTLFLMKLRMNWTTDDDYSIIMGEDFNVVLDPDLDGFGRKQKLKESAKEIKNICLLWDLVDIWRVRNPETKRFSTGLHNNAC